MPITPTNSDYHVPLSFLTPFLFISFGLAWTIVGLYVFFADAMSSRFGQLTGNHPLFFLAVYSPAIAAFALVVIRGGRKGLRLFLGRALIWRCSPGWYIFILIGIPLIFIVGSAFRRNLTTEALPLIPNESLMVALILAAIKGPIEEFGWRGFALPLLQRRLAPLWVGLVLGAIWGLWHTPAFFLSGTQQSGWSFSAFFIGCLAISIIATALFNGSRGSILLAAFFHFSLMNPIFPDAQPYDTYLLCITSIIIVWRFRDRMFESRYAITEVIPRRMPTDG